MPQLNNNTRQMWSNINLKESHTLQQISELSSVSVVSLLGILPESNLSIYRTNLDLI
jgi:hypothetical protein